MRVGIDGARRSNTRCNRVGARCAHTTPPCHAPERVTDGNWNCRERSGRVSAGSRSRSRDEADQASRVAGGAVAGGSRRAPTAQMMRAAPLSGRRKPTSATVAKTLCVTALGTTGAQHGAPWQPTS